MHIHLSASIQKKNISKTLKFSTGFQVFKQNLTIKVIILLHQIQLILHLYTRLQIDRV
jgi:hypothetical protein